MIFQEELQNVNLGDKRLDRRALVIGETFFRRPDKSIPVASETWAKTKACYRFLNNEKVDREKLLEPHYQQTKIRCEAQGRTLIIQDTTALSYPNHDGKMNFGITGTRNSKGRGVYVHTSLALNADTREPLGIVHQDVIIRNDFYPSSETQQDRLNRPTESQKWTNGISALKKLFPQKKDFVIVADREADVYVFMKEIIDSGYGFTIRQTQNRKSEEGLISSVIDKSEYRGEMLVDIPQRGGRKGRIAKMSLSSCKQVTIFSPLIRGRVLPPITINIVIVTDCVDKNLSWILLTTLPVDTEEDCRKVVETYQARWMIEEFHKGLKTGCSIEERQLIEEGAIENLLALFSVISVILLHLRHRSRNDDKCDYSLLSDSQMTILKFKFKKLSQNPTSKELLICIGMLGGFLGRKGDGMPGWIALVRGFMILYELEKGYLLAMELVGKR